MNTYHIPYNLLGSRKRVVNIEKVPGLTEFTFSKDEHRNKQLNVNIQREK
jgi:hypothetical protein